MLQSFGLAMNCTFLGLVAGHEISALITIFVVVVVLRGVDGVDVVGLAVVLREVVVNFVVDVVCRVVVVEVLVVEKEVVVVLLIIEVISVLTSSATRPSVVITSGSLNLQSTSSLGKHCFTVELNHRPGLQSKNRGFSFLHIIYFSHASGLGTNESIFSPLHGFRSVSKPHALHTRVITIKNLSLCILDSREKIQVMFERLVFFKLRITIGVFSSGNKYL
jgi:hypothetical protein